MWTGVAFWKAAGNPFLSKNRLVSSFFAKKKHWSENDMLENDGVSENQSNLFQLSKKNLKQIHTSKLYLCVSINKVEARWPGELQLELQQWERKAAGRDRDPFQFPSAFTMLIHPPLLYSNINQVHWFITRVLTQWTWQHLLFWQISYSLTSRRYWPSIWHQAFEIFILVTFPDRTHTKRAYLQCTSECPKQQPLSGPLR